MTKKREEDAARLIAQCLRQLRVIADECGLDDVGPPLEAALWRAQAHLGSDRPAATQH